MNYLDDDDVPEVRYYKQRPLLLFQGSRLMKPSWGMVVLTGLVVRGVLYMSRLRGRYGDLMCTLRLRW